MKIRVSAPAKVILFGEHSVVYGAPAIAASIDRRTTVEVYDNCDNILQFKFDKLGVDVSYSLPLSSTTISTDLSLQQRQAVQCGLDLCKNIISGITISVTSNFPLGAGLGSSASFSVSLAAALVVKENLNKTSEYNTNSDGSLEIPQALLDKTKILADNCEKIFHGNPSGIDTATCLLGGIVHFTREGGAKKIADFFPMKLAIVNSKVQRQTSAIVERVVELRKRLPSPSNNVFNAMRSVAEAATEEIQHSSESSERKLLDLVRMNHGLLYALNVSHPALERIGLAVAGLGVGFKLTGAGAGGNALVFIPQEVSTQVVCEKLNENGNDAEIVSVGVQGVHITLED